jgi:hypothetical protein
MKHGTDPNDSATCAVITGCVRVPMGVEDYTYKNEKGETKQGKRWKVCPCFLEEMGSEGDSGYVGHQAALRPHGAHDGLCGLHRRRSDGRQYGASRTGEMGALPSARLVGEEWNSV